MTAKEFYNSMAIKHQLKRAIKHDKQYFEDAIIELMEMYAQEQVKNLTIPVVKVRYLLIEWIGNNSIIDGCKHFDTKDECLEYWEKLPKIKGVEYTICETVNAP